MWWALIKRNEWPVESLAGELSFSWSVILFRAVS
ncbi:hypothetical protein MFFDBJGM_03518 [Pectobacterium versatile]|nr:hypothetical protein F018LOC_03207 [Pectobacterium versatile]GBO50489.1 hypothetical protein MFFDBJGM_03518 [Pectobacterium versatile]